MKYPAVLPTMFLIISNRITHLQCLLKTKELYYLTYGNKSEEEPL